MATRSSDSAARRSDRQDSKVLGRSAATGRFVLKPATKGGSISIREANTAVKTVSGSNKKK
jgi:hypothetical protein